MRVWYNGRTSAFQADDASSILATRSIFADIAQAVERILGKDEVPSSTLGISTIDCAAEIKFWLAMGLALSVELGVFKDS